MIKDLRDGEIINIKGKIAYTTNPKKFLKTKLGSIPFIMPINTPINQEITINNHNQIKILDNNLSTILKSLFKKLSLNPMERPRDNKIKYHTTIIDMLRNSATYGASPSTSPYTNTSDKNKPVININFNNFFR